MELTERFQQENSGVIRITIEMSSPAGEPGVQLSASLQQPVPGIPENGKFEFLEWLWL